MVRSWRLGLLIALSTCGLLSADRLAVQLRGGAKVSKAKRGKSAKKLEVHAYAADAPGLELRDYTYTEEVPLAADAVDVEVHACSLGSGDVQQLRGEWGPCVMPLVPGRDAVGVVVNVGSKVKGLVKGQRVAVLLGMGMDGEADDGADRSADSMTTGAAAHHLRVPARWAFPVPATLPTAHATGLVSVGGAIWAHLTQQRLERGAKIAVVGEGTAGQLAVSLAGHLGYDVYQLSEEPVPPVPEKSSKAARKAHKKRLHAADEAAGRRAGRLRAAVDPA
jgi:D-arabinose 1-dehydrogenase-like Zn-dependent alcohol dehydrogenase